MEKYIYSLNKKTLKKTELLLKSLPDPHNKIKCTDDSNILGHAMTTDNTITKAVNNRINKAKIAWGILRNSFITNINLPIKHRLIIPHVAIGGILL